MPICLSRVVRPFLLVALGLCVGGCGVSLSADEALIEEVASRPSQVDEEAKLIMPEGYIFEVYDPLELSRCGDGEGCANPDEISSDDGVPVWHSSLVVQDAIDGYCTTAVLRGLSEQLIEEVECMRPGTMDRIDSISGLWLGSAALPYLQTRAAESLQDVVWRGGSMGVNSTLRSLAQQYLLYEWYLAGRCGISLAASPGRSNHESGLAVDTSEYVERRWAFESEGWAWLGWSDPVHFDYLGSGTVNLSGLSVLAFQRLWNREHPQDPISEDGVYGAQTRTRLARAPVAGFGAGTSCSVVEEEVAASLGAIEVYWYRQPDGAYSLRALAGDSVVRVTYQVDGYVIAESTRAAGQNFPAVYRFYQNSNERLFEVIGYDSAGQEVARGRGLIDVTAGVGVYIKQLGQSLYEIGLERAPDGVAFIKVEVDGQYTLTDQISGESLSSRLGVRSLFSQLGERSFSISTYNEDGSLRGTLRRTFELR